MEPGLIGGEVNCILAAYQNRHNRLIQYKTGPDPSSIDSCILRVIVSNSLSGMCTDMWITFVDGTTLHTIDKWYNICICLVIRRRKKFRTCEAALS